MTIENREKRKKTVGSQISWRNIKKKETVKYQVEVWTAYAEQQNAMNVT